MASSTQSGMSGLIYWEIIQKSLLFTFDKPISTGVVGMRLSKGNTMFLVVFTKGGLLTSKSVRVKSGNLHCIGQPFQGWQLNRNERNTLKTQEPCLPRSAISLGSTDHGPFM